MDFGRTPSANLIAEQAHSGVIPLSALMALSNDGFFFVSADAHVTQWSEAAAALSGVTTGEALDHDVRELFIKGEKIVAIPFDAHPHDVRVAVALPDETRWLRISVIGVNVDAQTYGWLCSLGPERRYREIEQLKNEIVTTVSHELKTPIASIKAYATTLRENPGAIAAVHDEFLAVIDEQADRLTRAVDNLLLASRVDAEQLLRHRVPIPLDEVLDAALCVLLLDESRHPVVRKTAGVMLSGDPELLRDIFLHLVDNAAKFSPAGTPIEIEGRNSERESVVSVSDRGIGIADEHLPYIFDRFYRVERELTAQTPGAGLGLFIVQALVRAHGGSISVESTLGAGTTFTLRLPLR
jgi:two-component system phosphate regulon sensor histidine kinase PhoR